MLASPGWFPEGWAARVSGSRASDLNTGGCHVLERFKLSLLVFFSVFPEQNPQGPILTKHGKNPVIE